MDLKKQLKSPYPGPRGALGAQASQGQACCLSSGVVTNGFHVSIAAPGSQKVDGV